MPADKTTSGSGKSPSYRETITEKYVDALGELEKVKEIQEYIAKTAKRRGSKADLARIELAHAKFLEARKAVERLTGQVKARTDELDKFEIFFDGDFQPVELDPSELEPDGTITLSLESMASGYAAEPRASTELEDSLSVLEAQVSEAMDHVDVVCDRVESYFKNRDL